MRTLRDLWRGRSPFVVCDGGDAGTAGHKKRWPAPQGAVWSGLALILLLALCPCGFALNPALDVSQYAHTSWKNRDGFAKGEIHDIAQTADGYLWLATEFGILRFDGVRTTPWQPPPLPSDFIYRLLAARDGALWIGTRNGLAVWKNGRLRQYPEFAGFAVAALVEDHTGAIWAGGPGTNDGKLCEIRNDQVHCYPEIHGPHSEVTALHEDRQGNLWAGSFGGAWRWRPGMREFYATPDERMRGFADSSDGGILIAPSGGVRRLADGKSTLVWPFPAAQQASRGSGMLRDRDGGLWVGTADAGVIHVHNGRTDVFAETDGLSANLVNQIFEDREANIWVATRNGLDRFRELPVVTWTSRQGLSSPASGAVLAGKDGSLWAGTLDGLNRLKDGQVMAWRARGSNSISGLRSIEVKNMPGNGIEALFQDSRGRIWFGARKAVGYLEDDRFLASAAPGGNIDAFAEDAAGNIWFDEQARGLAKITPQNEVRQISWSVLGHKDPGDPMVADPAGVGVWLGFFEGGIGRVENATVKEAYTSAQGLATGRVYDLRFDREGALWVAAKGGLSRVKNGRITSLSSRNTLPCDTVFWTIEDDERALWLSMPCGLVRIARPELDAWTAGGDVARDNVHQTLRSVVFDNSDGAASFGDMGGYTPRVARSTDGKLWFSTPEGLSSVDPHHLPFNKLPPPVHIEQINADRKIYDPAQGNVRLPALVRDVEIDYTALSLSAPEKIRFRYKLEGEDADWHDVGNRRQAFYNDLKPRHYRFRVAAANNSGVWNDAGASLDFSIDPAYYQTAWFRTSLAAALLALLVLVYRFRLRRVAQQYDIRMEERIGERTRIARDLHDTLLQSFQGVLLKFYAITYLLPDRPEAREQLEGAIEQARQAIAEGRDAVQGLRESTLATNDLAGTIGAIGNELVSESALISESANGNGPAFSVEVEGASLDLAPLVRDEVYRIAVEALRNAFRHAQATRVEAAIHYERKQLRISVRDDGRGMEQNAHGPLSPNGHHGLNGMRERAGLIAGKLTVWSKPGAGTEIELIVPASMAYAKSVRHPDK